MGWFSSSPAPAQQFTDAALSPPQNLASDLKPLSTSESQTNKPKPCCVCKDEKTARDDCMLFSTGDDPQEDCKGTVERYRECMRGFGFKVQ